MVEKKEWPQYLTPQKRINPTLVTQNIDDLHRAAGPTRFDLCIRRNSPDFVRLANALPALYPKGSDEKILLDAMLLAVLR